jgi:3-dehydroquinate dehydratase-2
MLTVLHAVLQSIEWAGLRTFPQFRRARNLGTRCDAGKDEETGYIDNVAAFLFNVEPESFYSSKLLPSTTNTNIYTYTKMATKSILLINGPNLNLLGTREPSIYGSDTLSDVTQAAAAQCSKLSINFSHTQSNHEGVLIDAIHAARGNVDFIVINPGAFTHTSVAIRDALVGVDIPFVEVHISNVHKREAFRHHSYLSDKAEAVIAGLGVYGYEAAIVFAARELAKKDKAQL